MDWKNIGQSFLNAGLPLFGTLLAGPVGGIAGKAAAGLISGKLGIKEDELTPEKYIEILGNPDMIVKLKQLELDHELDLERLIIEDRKSARQREVEIVKATGTKDINLYVLAWVMVVGFFTLLGILMFNSLPPDQNGVIFMLFGALATSFGSVIAYFFGSSKGSADKTHLLAEKK